MLRWTLNPALLAIRLWVELSVGLHGNRVRSTNLFNLMLTVKAIYYSFRIELYISFDGE